VIERPTIEKTTGKPSTETVYGLTRHTPATADPARVLAFNRGHWTIENGCHYLLDWNWDEDRCTLRTGHGPENITALRRFAIGVIKSKSRDTVAATIQRLARNVRLVFDYLRMTDNSRRRRPLRVRFEQLHNDSASIAFCGQYARATGGRIRARRAPAITYGYSKDHRPDLKQLLFILTLEAEGGVPVQFRCLDGNTSDSQTHIETWNTLRTVAGRPDFLYVADSKLCARENTPAHQ